MRKIDNELFFSFVETEIAEGRPVRFRLRGRSMYPLLRDGIDEVMLYPCKDEALKPMDVVLFRYKGIHVLHRIIRISGDVLHIRGDGSFLAREQCKVSDVVGKVRFVIRSNGKPLSVDSCRWRLPSLLWNHIGFIRPLLLRLLRSRVEAPFR